MRAFVAAVLLGMIGSAVLVAGDTGAQSSPGITLSVFRLYDSGNRAYRFRFNGTISNRAANEYVTVMRQTCGLSFATAIAGAQTRAGGFWEVETPRAPHPDFDSSTYFARWGSARSRPVRFRGRLFMNVTELGNGRFTIYVTKDEAQQDLRGRQIVLQRLHAGRWLRVAVARLRPERTQPSTWVASFTVRTPGWTLRAVIPAKNARPCFNQSATERFTS